MSGGYSTTVELIDKPNKTHGHII